MRLLVELLMEVFLLLGEEVHSIVAHLSQTDPLHRFAACSKCVVSFLSFACDECSVLMRERFVDRLALLLCGILSACKDCLGYL